MDDPLPGEVRRYYQTVGRFLEAEAGTREDERFWRELGREFAGRHALDVGAGTGRVTRLLAEEGMEALGIDVSPELLSMARDRLRNQRHVSLIQADMRTLDLAQRFDLIVAAGDPFSHLCADADRARAMVVLARHLVPGGTFVLDALWLSAAAQDQVGEANGRVRQRELVVDGERFAETERWRCDTTSRLCSAEYHYRQAEGGASQAAFQARYWSADELRHLLAAASLAPDAWWGDYTRAPWDAETSSRLIVRAHRLVAETAGGFS
ncbi:MAG: class I SAM-dependent methyltransferase [Chloroflexota bacterium]